MNFRMDPSVKTGSYTISAYKKDSSLLCLKDLYASLETVSAREEKAFLKVSDPWLKTCNLKM